MTLETGYQLQQGRYVIQSVLGQGGMGTVYLGADRNLPGRLVAIKENADASQSAQEQFQREAVLLARLNHPNLPRVTDHFIEPSGLQYLVMDYVEGEDLREVQQQQGGPLPEALALSWIEQVMSALEHMHNWIDPATRRPSPIIHRDIKPGNIKRTPNGRIVLVDFGLAKYEANDEATVAGARAFTSGYSPIEQYTGGTNVRSDIYALGATLYTLLTNQRPPDAMALASGAHLVPPRQLNAQISRTTERVILHAMQVQADGRYQSITAMRDALLNRRAPTSRSTPITQQSDYILSTYTKRTDRRVSNVFLWVGGVLLIGLLAVGIALSAPMANQWRNLLGSRLPTATALLVTATPAQTPASTPALTAVTNTPAAVAVGITDTVTTTVTATVTATSTGLQTDIPPTIIPITMTLPDTATPLPSPTATPTRAQPTATATTPPTATPTQTTRPTATATALPTVTATATTRPVTATATDTPTVVLSPTATTPPKPTATVTTRPATATATRQPTATMTSIPTATPRATNTATRLPTLSPTPTASATPTAKPTQTATPRPQPTATATLTPTLVVNNAPPTAGETRVNALDQATYVFIPGGDFLMGSTLETDEQPEHTVTVTSFWISQTEITNAQYGRCVEAGECTPPHNSDWETPERADFPVTHLDWGQASTYAHWAGGHLPTEAQWEKAARGTDGRTFPWGNEGADAQHLNFNSSQGPVAVGSYPAGASPYGVLDMAGNVEEWVADWYAPDIYQQASNDNPTGPDTGIFRVVRGGSFNSSLGGVRAASRDRALPATYFDSVGFRIFIPEADLK